MARFYTILIAFLIVGAFSKASAYSFVTINIDQKTLDLMSTVYATQLELERAKADFDHKISEEYRKAVEASSVIFVSKYLTQKALSNAGLWSEYENAYYQQIRTLVPMIMAKMVRLAKLMLRSPVTAMYWGNYLVRTCQEVQDLCCMFQSVVTNSKLGFSDLTFLNVSEEFRSMIDFSTYNGIDWKAQLEALGHIDVTFNKENILEELKASIAEAGMMAAGAPIDILSDIKHESGILQSQKVGVVEVIKLIVAWQDIFDNVMALEENAKQACKMIDLRPEKLFEALPFNFIGWDTDYLETNEGMLYTQMWHIVPSGKGEGDAVYSVMFDSGKQKMSDVQSDLASRMSDLNTAAGEAAYELISGQKRYYSTASAEKVSGCSQAIVSVTCHDSDNLGEQSSVYKCWDCGSKISEHSKQCAMATSLSQTIDDDLKQAESNLDAITSEIATLKQSIAAIEVELASLLTAIDEASAAGDSGKAEDLRNQYKAKAAARDELNEKLDAAKEEESELQDAVSSIQAEMDSEDDTANRIPYIMNLVRKAYGIQWEDEGHWDGYTFVRKGKSATGMQPYEFRATLSMKQKVKKKLGIRIHRARMQIDWTIDTSHDNTQVYQVVELNPNASESENSIKVNAVIADAVAEYPNCDITTEYIKVEVPSSPEPDSSLHLLWASDRLEVAIKATDRLVRIYSSLVQAERMMHFKFDVVDALLGVSGTINWEYGRRQSLAEERRQVWKSNAREALLGNPDKNNNNGSQDD